MGAKAGNPQTVISLLAEAIPERFPNVRFVVPHLGGTITFLLSRTALLGSRTAGFKMGDYNRLADVDAEIARRVSALRGD